MKYVTYSISAAVTTAMEELKIMRQRLDAYYGDTAPRLVRLEEDVAHLKEGQKLEPPTGLPLFDSDPLDDVMIEITANQMLDFEEQEDALEDAHALLERWVNDHVERIFAGRTSPTLVEPLENLIEDTLSHLEEWK